MKILLLILTLFCVSSCSTVKPYERQFISDESMQMSKTSIQEFKSYSFSIREGANFPSNAKSSGGCGCN